MTAIRFEPYKARKIEFRGLHSTQDWHVKVYTITNRSEFQSLQVLDKVIEILPEWLQNATLSPLPIYNVAFLIVHEAREGCWVLCNWWTGGEMIETTVYFAHDHTSGTLAISPRPGALVCIWELEVFAHERNAWIAHILSDNGIPDFTAYLNDTL